MSAENATMASLAGVALRRKSSGNRLFIVVLAILFQEIVFWLVSKD